MMNESYLELFDRHRNLVPILSIEGGKKTTDDRRGGCVLYERREQVEALLNQA